MYDGKKIILGLIIFLGLITYPIWHNTLSGKTSYVPKPELPTDKAKKECVEPKTFIRVNHKQLLEDWKASVVRDGMRTYQASNKKKYIMSLNRTCMSCHTDKTKFCDQCHSFMGVTNKCWDCHIYPKQLSPGPLAMREPGKYLISPSPFNKRGEFEGMKRCNSIEEDS